MTVPYHPGAYEFVKDNAESMTVAVRIPASAVESYLRNRRNTTSPFITANYVSRSFSVSRHELEPSFRSNMLKLVRGNRDINSRIYMTLFSVVPGQLYRKKLSPEATNKMLEMAKKRPRERFDLISRAKGMCVPHSFILMTL